MHWREDFKKAIAHQPVWPIPYSVKFTVESRQKLTDHLGRAFDPIEETGSYVVASHTNDGWAEVKPCYFRDPFGVVWNKTRDKTLGVVEDSLIKAPSLGGFRFPDPEAIPVYGLIEQHARRYPDRFHMLSIGFCLFERAWSLVGMENLMMYMLLEPDFIHELLDRITDYNVRVIELGAKLGVDCVHLGDDWGAQNGLLIRRDMWQEFIRPRFARMCRAARQAGLLVSLHCCGKVDVLFEEMIEAGVDVFDPFQPEVMDIWRLRERYRGRLAFWGGLSVQRTLPHGTADDVRRETRRLLDEMALGGGYILSPSHSLTGDIPVENLLAYLEVARNQTS